MQRNTVKGPEFLKMYLQKNDIIKVLSDDSVSGDVLRKIEGMVLNALQRGYVDIKIRPYQPASAPNLSPETKRGIKMARLSNSAEGFFSAAQRVKRRGSIEDRLETLKDEIQRNGDSELINNIHHFLVDNKLAENLTGNYKPQV